MRNSTAVLLFLVGGFLFFSFPAFAQTISFKDAIEKNSAKYQVWKIETYMSLKKKAEEDLWESPRKNARWFVDNNYSERNEKPFIISQMRTYLFPENVWEDYLFATAIRVDLEVKKLVNDVMVESGVAKPGEVTNVHVPIDMPKHYATRLPTPAEVAESVYTDLEKSGVNRVPESELRRMWERFVAKNPKTALTFSAFVAITSGLMTSNPYVGAGIFATLGISESVILEEKEKFYSTLVGSISDQQDSFNTVLKNTTFNVCELSYI